jgi:hypothetical protein
MSHCTTEPFKVTCKLIDGRINSADGLLFLDSILYHAWFLKYAPGVMQGTQKLEDIEHPEYKLNFGLPLRQIGDGRYAASCGFYHQYDEKIEYWNKHPNWDDHADHLDSEGKIKTGQGTMRAYRMPQVIKTVGDIEFYGYGTINKIRELLTYIPSLGKKPAAGWGMVAQWVVEPFAEDWSTWSDKYGLMRPIPLGEDVKRDLNEYVKRVCAIKPPAWKACNQVPCYVPKVNI